MHSIIRISNDLVYFHYGKSESVHIIVMYYCIVHFYRKAIGLNRELFWEIN